MIELLETADLACASEKAVAKIFDERVRFESGFFEEHCRQNAMPPIKGEMTAGKLKWRGIFVAVKRCGGNITKVLMQRDKEISPMLEIRYCTAHSILTDLLTKKDYANADN